jgi:hypothetical protein
MSTDQLSTELGKLTNVKLKEVFPHEEYDFTPWLAEENNIANLADTLGIELQVEGIEVPVGPFTADVLARTASDTYVIIENQFGKTNHEHLGKTLTYAATLSADSVIWIAERFTAEHKRAIEWLNERTTEGLGLYAVEAELLKIDGSKPAIRFNVITKPVELVKRGAEIKTAGQLTDAKKLQFEF